MSGPICAAVRRHAAERPTAPALVGAGVTLDYAGLWAEVAWIAEEIAARQPRVLALGLDNGPAWAVVDLAAQWAGVTVVPLPPFFSRAQVEHVCRDAGVDALLTDAGADPAWLPQGSASDSFTVCGSPYRWQRLPQEESRCDLDGIAKVTYTSGTTGAPKGVMLAEITMAAVAESLVTAAAATADDRHLCLLPLGVLLENVAGLYAPLMVGATAIIPPLAAVGVRGAAGLDSRTMVAALRQWRATTAITLPQSLQGIVEALEQGAASPVDQRFLAVGGAPVSRQLLQRARSAGLPVYEGYGLSECGSVVALNTPGHHRSGSVGRPLPHVRVAIAADGEILVTGEWFAGYLGAGPRWVAPGTWATGDLGHLDAQGFLHVTGRKKSLFITSFGRNVAPEWVERELALAPAIAQVAVFGEGRPWNAAVVTVAPGHDATAVDRAIAQTNQTLPDYARIRRWIAAAEPFTAANRLLTGTGRLRRAAILTAYEGAIAALYQEESLAR